MPAPFETFFLDADGGRPGQRFCILHAAQAAAVKGQVVYVHPFAEELNKSRRMAAAQSRALACAGYEVLQIDLFGCGDSSGDFGDASWQAWIDDVVQACHWLQGGVRRKRQAANPTLWLWGLRTGCLLAAEAARHLDDPCNFLFWAPMQAGKVQLQQFLRLKAASQLLGSGEKGVTEALRQQLANGLPVEVAGYMVAPELAHGMEHSRLEPQKLGRAAVSRRVEWFEISTREGAALSPMANQAIDSWVQHGFSVRSHVVNGPAFWQTVEMEEAPALLDATICGLAEESPTSLA